METESMETESMEPKSVETEETLERRVEEKLCQLAFEGGGTAQQVRSLELLAKLLGLFEGGRELPPVTIVEDV